MRDFVQYHKGEYAPSKRSFGIRTGKSFSSLEGDRIWLITRAGDPLRYCLAETFPVEKVEYLNRQKQPIIASSRHGTSFNKPIAIDGEPWFGELFRAAGSFAFGLQRIKSNRVVSGLKRVLANSNREAKKVRSRDIPQSGAGFGDYKTNCRVESAAIREVRERYSARGWTVISREMERLGFDLECMRGSKVHHVEVKGVRSSICSFVITSNEKRMAEADPNYRLIVVTHVLQGKLRKCRVFQGAELTTRFEVSPISFIAKLKTVGSRYA